MAGLSDTIDSLAKGRSLTEIDLMRHFACSTTRSRHAERICASSSLMASIGREVAGKFRQGVLPDNPWPVIGGVAFGTLALGFLLGRRWSSAASPSSP